MENYKSMPCIDFGGGGSSSSSNNSMTEETIRQIVTQMISGISTMEFKIVETLPSVGEKKYIYLVKSLVEGKEDNIYDEYIWLENLDPLKSKYEIIGSTAINLNDYYTKAQIGSVIVSNIQINNKISDLYKKLILNVSVKNLISEKTSNIGIGIPEVSFDPLDSSMNCNGLMSPNHVKSIEELESKSIETFNLTKLIDKNVIDFTKEITYKEITDQNLLKEIFGSSKEFERLCNLFISGKLDFVCYKQGKQNSDESLIKISLINTWVTKISNIFYLTFDYFYDTDGDYNHIVMSKLIMQYDTSIETNNLSTIFFNQKSITSNLVIDSLDANSSFSPLSANQGRILNDKIKNLEGTFDLGGFFTSAGEIQTTITKDNVLKEIFVSYENLINNLRKYKDGNLRFVIKDNNSSSTVSGNNSSVVLKTVVYNYTGNIWSNTIEPDEELSLVIYASKMFGISSQYAINDLVILINFQSGNVISYSASKKSVLTENNINDSLTSTDSKKSLSANQGKILNDKIEILHKTFNINDCFFGGHTIDNVLVNYFKNETELTALIARIKSKRTQVSYDVTVDNVYYSENAIYYRISTNTISGQNKVKFTADFTDHYDNKKILAIFEYDYVTKRISAFTATKTAITP